MKRKPPEKPLTVIFSIAAASSLAIAPAFAQQSNGNDTATDVKTTSQDSPDNQMTDENISQVVKQKLAWDSGLEDDKINVSVEDGRVTLDGHVASLTEKQRAATIVRSRKGVSEVENNLTVEGKQKSNDELKTNVSEAIEDDNALANSEIKAEVENGVVTLTGNVEQQSRKDLAGQVVGDVAGVNEIENQIEVASADQTRSDEELQQAIRDRIDFDAWLDPAQIEVEVNEGTAMLSGTVANADQKERARKRAHIQGVSEVEIAELKVETNGGTPEEVAEIRRENQDGQPTQQSSQDKAEQTQQAQSDTRQYDGTTRKIMSDSEIKDAVQAYFSDEPRVSDADIEIEVQDSVVTLSGEVPDRLAKRTALREAGNVFGVAEIKNNLEVASGDPAGIESLKERARNALARNSTLEESDIDLQVENNEVTLDGNVGSTYAKNKAETVVSGLKGVQGVRNNLQVQQSQAQGDSEQSTSATTQTASDNTQDQTEGSQEAESDGFTYYAFYYTYPDAYEWSDYESENEQSAQSTDTNTTRQSQDAEYSENQQQAMPDAELAEEVRDEIFWSWFVDSDTVNVDVDDGEVTLTGTVEDLGEKEAAAKNARDAGAQSVDNRLKITQR